MRISCKHKPQPPLKEPSTPFKGPQSFRLVGFWLVGTTYMTHMAVTRNRGLLRSPRPPLFHAFVAGLLLQTLVAGLCVQYCSLQFRLVAGRVCRKTPRFCYKPCRKKATRACYKPGILGRCHIGIRDGSFEGFSMAHVGIFYGSFKDDIQYIWLIYKYVMVLSRIMFNLLQGGCRPPKYPKQWSLYPLFWDEGHCF